MQLASSIPELEPNLLRSVRACRLFKDLDDAEVRDLLPVCTLLRLRQGDHLWRTGDPATSFHHVVRGLIELRRAAGSYDATLMAFFGPTECPAVPVVLGRKAYGADAVVISDDATVLSIQAEPLLSRMERDPRIAMAINRALLAQMRLLHGKIDVMVAGTVPRRLALFLLNLADRFGDEFEHGETVIPFALNRQQVATYVNARVETVIRALSVWRKAGLVDFRRDSIVLHDVDSLQQAVAA
ncbi:MAG: Crp/Fnr family transcriptional regulator [Sandaracinus sp.]|nr:Crp/Fnr family transcriptional regulator [Sandaracinus sp.]MCB9617619.1 Crp/Fnr family transcriptional regulator [Sandaracinus sp.]MCB9622892.1 Crp/Fnr family transcriptional regulator [Sandaracinus sp.]